jgi:hypothetical protein
MALQSQEETLVPVSVVGMAVLMVSKLLSGQLFDFLEE